MTLNSLVHKELWTSWASLLRSYAAAHGLNATQHAVVEVSPEEIVLRVGLRTVRFTQDAMTVGDLPTAFSIKENGTVRVGTKAPEEMDAAAEEITRTLLFPTAAV